MPAFDRHLAGDDQRAAIVAVVDNLQQITTLHPQPVMPQDLQQVAATTSEDVDVPGERICGAPHIRSYVSGVIMWRRRAAARDFSAVGRLGRHII